MKKVDLDDYVGRRYGRLTVVSYGDDSITKYGKRRTQLRCVCDCGNVVDVLPSNLRKNNTKSCGCLCDETRITNSIKHGDRHNRLYSIWTNIKTRCYNRNSRTYETYGLRGIKMCDEWASSYESFKEWAVESGYKDDKECTIDRIDVNGDYEPDNCRWATPKEQANNRRNTVYVQAHGESHTISEWADITGTKYHTLFARIFRLGWNPEDAIVIPK